MKHLKLYNFYIILILLGLTGCNNIKEGELGSKSNPLKIYFAPSLDAKIILADVSDLISYLENETGYYYKVEVPNTNYDIIKAFESKKADFAEINSFSYLIINEKFNAEALLRVVREGNEKSYRGEIITRYDSGIKSIDQLSGKKFAFVDSTSTSGFILPQALLNKKNIKIGQAIFANKHDSVVSLVYNGKVDAGATYYNPPDSKNGKMQDSRASLINKYPDIESKVKIIGFTPDIPNDPWVFRKDLDSKMKKNIVDALIKYVQTEKGKKVLSQIAHITDLIPALDSDYDYLRGLIKEQKINSEALIQKE